MFSVQRTAIRDKAILSSFAEGGLTTTAFEETFISQNNFKSDNTPQPTQSVDATFANEDGDEISVNVGKVTIE